MKNVSMILYIFLAFVVGIIFLQIKLSKSENKWLGLILPIMSFLLSIFYVLGMALYTSFVSFEQTVLPDGTIIENIIEQGTKPITNTASFVFQVIYVLFITNIPTAILMIIYFSCRQMLKRSKEIDKMNIQDLE